MHAQAQKCFEYHYQLFDTDVSKCIYAKIFGFTLRVSRVFLNAVDHAGTG